MPSFSEMLESNRHHLFVQHQGALLEMEAAI